MSSPTDPVSSTLAVEIAQLPSIKDGITLKEEADKRRKTCRFIEEAGRVLKLPRVAVATAMVFFHRFYAKHSFTEHDRFEVAVACLLLASKTEESPRKLNTVIDECYKLKQRGMQAGRISQNSPNHPNSAINITGSLDPKGEEFLKLKERILLLERVVLHTIGFELSIEHPYKYMVEQIKKMVNERKVEYITPSLDKTPTKAREQLANDLTQYSINFANDSMHTSLCLQFPPSTIATACIYLCAPFAKVRTTGGMSWYEVLGEPDVESLACKYFVHWACIVWDVLWNSYQQERVVSLFVAAICIQIMELITDKKGADMEPFKKIRAELEQMRSQPTGGKQAPPPPPPGPDSKRPRVG